MQNVHELKTIADEELLRRLAALLAASRHNEADLVAHVGEADARRLYARQAAPSMFAYCTERLHLSEAEACLRIAAGRASRQHPVILDMLADGRLHLSAIAKLAPHLTPENRDELLRRATHKTKREIDELVAELAPRPDVPAVIRKLPAGRFVARPVSRRFRFGSATEQPIVEVRPERVDSESSDSVSGSGPGPSEPVGAAARLEAESGGLERPQDSAARPDTARGGQPCFSSVADVRSQPRSDADPASLSRAHVDPGLQWVAARVRPAVVEALAPARYKVQFTASAELRDKLERLRALMRSSIPDGDLAAVVEAAVTEKLERLEARRFGRTRSPRKTLSTSNTSPRSRHIPAAVKRAVGERDEDRCRYVDARGNRCSARVRLEHHHRHTFALGGDHSPHNVSLLCHAHNRLLAEIDYGRSGIERHRESRVAAPLTS